MPKDADHSAGLRGGGGVVYKYTYIYSIYIYIVYVTVYIRRSECCMKRRLKSISRSAGENCQEALENALTPDFTVSLRCGLIGQNKAPAS